MSGSETPVPTPDERSAPFFEGARAGRLMLQRCTSCEAWQVPVRARCNACGALALDWAQASGRGRVFAWTRLHRAPGAPARLPRILASVDLAEGVRLVATLVGSDADGVRCGDPVEVVFEPVAEGVAVPVFRRAAADPPPLSPP